MTQVMTLGTTTMRPRPFLVRVLLLAFVLLFASAPSGCVGCGGEPETSEAHTLRAAFPEHAALVLENAYALRPAGEGFALAPEDHARVARLRGLELRLPAVGSAGVRFELDGGLVIKVHETGIAEGEGVLAGNAVAFAREGGTSYWSVNDKGYQEWLHLDAGVAASGKPIASWEIEGATLRSRREGSSSPTRSGRRG